MNKALFGKTGLQVSPLGFGGAPIGYVNSDQENAGRILNQLLDAGVNLFDTASSYMGCEELIGNTIAHRRGQFVLVSKCGQKYQGVPPDSWSAAAIGQAIDRSLERLRTDHVDVMLLHTCDLATLKKGEALAAVVKARQAGKVKFCGFSGDNEAAAYAAGLPDIMVIETSINITDQANIDMVLPLARQHQIGVIAKRPMANAAWKAPEEQPGMYRSYASTYTKRLQAMALTPKELGFDGDPPTAWAEIALRFTIGQPGLHCAVVGTTNPARVADNVAYAQRGPLPEAAVRKIREAFARAEKQAGEKWTGQT